MTQNLEITEVSSSVKISKITYITIFLIIVSIFISFYSIAITLYTLPIFIAIFLFGISKDLNILISIPSKYKRYQIPTGKDATELAKVFDNAHNFVYVIGGELDHHVWLENHVVQSINNALNRNVDIKIACGPNFDIENTFIAELANDGKISLFRLKNRENEHHFRINDRLDTLYHSALDNTKNNLIWFENAFSGDLFIDRFSKIISDSTNADRIEKFSFGQAFSDHFITINDNRQRGYSTPDQEKKLQLTVLGKK